MTSGLPVIRKIALSFQGMRFISATANLFIQMIQMKVAANF